MSRLDKISTLSQNLKRIWQKLKGPLSILQKLNMLWQITFAIGHIFNATNDQIFNTPSGHTDPPPITATYLP